MVGFPQTALWRNNHGARRAVWGQHIRLLGQLDEVNGRGGHLLSGFLR